MKKLFMGKEVAYFSLYSIFSAGVFETPIFFMYLASKGLKYSEITYIFSIYAFSVIFLEYLTGVFADRYGKKNVLIVATISFIIGQVIFIFGETFIHFVGGILLMSLSVASRSGADIAYLYDKLDEIGKKDDFDDIMSNLGSIMSIVAASAVIIGPILTNYGMIVPFVFTIIFSSFALLMILKFEEPKIENKETSTKQIFKKSITIALSNKSILGYILLSILIFPTYHILNQLAQPYLNVSEVRIEFFGMFYAVLALFQSVGTKISTSISKKFTIERAIALGCFMIAGGYMLMSIKLNYIAYIIPAVMGISYGIYYTLSSIGLNKVIQSDFRSSLLSFQHALTKTAQMAIFGVFGLVIDNGPLRAIFAFLSLYLVIGVSLIFIVFRNRFNTQEDCQDCHIPSEENDA